MAKKKKRKNLPVFILVALFILLLGVVLVATQYEKILDSSASIRGVGQPKVLNSGICGHVGQECCVWDRVVKGYTRFCLDRAKIKCIQHKSRGICVSVDSPGTRMPASK